MPEVHPTAVVSPRAELDEGVKIGPYSIIGDHVRIGRDTTLESHVVVEGHTEIGERNRIHPFVSIGSSPQDLGYKGEETRVVIGNGNLIKEFVTVNRATTKQDWVTIVGDDNYLMAYAHIAHDCRLGNKITMSNVATLGGHTVIGDHAILGGLVAVHQFVRIGSYAFVGGKSGVDRDVPPFMIVAGERAKLYGLNRRGLVRHGFSQEAIDGLKRAYRILWRGNRPFGEGISRVRQEIASFPELEVLLSFFEGSKRGILRD
jgi:UDP-N-acetylglucosamine acyltransferase